MKLVYSIILGLIVISCQSIQAQDQHFSQFFAAPLNLNPALAGAYEGSYRVGAIYRDQWRTVLDHPISTYGVGGDLRYNMPFSDAKNPDAASIGFQFFGDNAALYDLNTNQISLFFAYHKALDKRTRQYLSVGFQLGIAQRNINYEDLTFGDQFNNLNAYDQPTSELLPVNNFAYGDYGIGLHYTITPSDFFNFNAGYSLAHFHTPNISFFENLDVVNPDLERENELYMKHAAYFNTEFRVSEQVRLTPRALFLNQGPHQELNVGSGIRLARNEAARQAFHIGTFLRGVRDEDAYALDALILLAGFEYDNMLIGFSYDLNLRDLLTDRQGIGIFEFSISYIGEYENDFNFCPTF
ncbi:PorP/SprF family type IX secretion system membrane protein [Portibacter marinus]|uniref:PorP/SprF family type IX secretion system membrane protein n=1 Tax=Portibacter marinus TaxID=2898660 RepID=UPI001F3AF603|nr:PorP/SprF family type IX secretion system membrane protein [Portibacter marinus]